MDLLENSVDFKMPKIKTSDTFDSEKNIKNNF